MRAAKVVPDDVSGLGNMKKQYLWLFAMPIMLAMLCSSCTKENDSGDNGNGNNNIDNRKIEKTTTLLYGDHGDYTDGSINSNYTYEWDGDKLMKLDDATGWDMAFTYDGDNVSEVFWYSDNGGSIHPYRRYNYTYSGDKVIEYTETYLSNGSNSTTTYHVNYDNEGNVSEITASNNDRNITNRYTWQNGNVTQYYKRFEALYEGGRSYTTTQTYTRNNHKTLNYLIAGYGARQYANGYSPSSINSVLTSSISTVYDDGSESVTTREYDYTYDGEYIVSATTTYHPSGDKYTTYYKYTNTSDPTPTTYRVIARVYDYGTVRGGGTYAVGKTVKLLAIPDDGYHFVQWSNGSTSNPLVFTVTNDVEYQATFEAD